MITLNNTLFKYLLDTSANTINSYTSILESHSEMQNKNLKLICEILVEIRDILSALQSLQHAASVDRKAMTLEQDSLVNIPTEVILLKADENISNDITIENNFEGLDEYIYLNL